MFRALQSKLNVQVCVIRGLENLSDEELRACPERDGAGEAPEIIELPPGAISQVALAAIGASGLLVLQATSTLFLFDAERRSLP
jgi:hypothetical protein